MSNATLTVSVTLTGGGVSRSAELSQLKRAADIALEAVCGANGTAESGTVYGDGGSTGASASPVSATFDYVPVAAS